MVKEQMKVLFQQSSDSTAYDLGVSLHRKPIIERRTISKVFLMVLVFGIWIKDL